MKSLGRKGPFQAALPASGGGMLRTIAVWGFGLIAAAIFGGLVGEFLVERGGAYVGMIGGVFAFACVRICLMGR
ncbi:hypothetical protein AUC69_08615 [Methyloceanibacter superfactus]|uniref:Uncharacterized protein n=2 Tax=Methyloceanibacter superfactus TaxID=1774969 RepID=A0A1E3W1K7_9HYPH|nr:hypothetical protein AUC69_08615 [Methyloceanibacter superfactus]